MSARILKLTPIPVNRELVIDAVFTFYYYEHGKDFFFEGERHDFWEMVYVDSGNVLAKTENSCFILPQGSVIFHKPMEFHSLEAINNKPHNIMVITFSSASEAISFFENKIFSINTHQAKILSRFAEEMTNYLGKSFEPEDKSNLPESKFGSMQLGISHFEHFLIELIRENNESASNLKPPITTKNTESIFADVVKNYLAEMVESPLTLAEVCKHFNVSKSHLCRIFKNETGRSIMDYYIDLKIAKAKLLIREGDLNLTQIAERLGYSGIHHFSRIFKTRVKMSPGSYAKSIK